MTEPRLVIFDVDGTLVDSQNDIVAAMTAAFAAQDLALPPRPEILSIVGLSLDVAMRRLAPDASVARCDALVQSYKDAYFRLRSQVGVAVSSPLFKGARAALDRLRAEDHTVLAVATGKSARGLSKLIEGHGLESCFASLQTADDHPSKPHPSMIDRCLEETGIAANRAVIVGDTEFDMDMGRAAGVGCIGVSWGYHAPVRLRADAIIDSFAELPAAIDAVLGRMS